MPENAKVEEAVKLVHLITNEMQAVLGYLELDECEKAVPHTAEVIPLLQRLSKTLKEIKKAA